MKDERLDVDIQQEELMSLADRIIALKMKAAANIVAERKAEAAKKQWEEDQRSLENWTND